MVPLHKAKVMRENAALRRLHAARNALSEASHYRLECERAVKENARTLAHREDAIFRRVIKKVVGSSEIDTVKEDVLQLHKGHQKLEDELENATQQQQKLFGEVEEARQVHSTALRALQKFDLALEEILAAKVSFENQAEEAETEDVFGKGRRSLA